MKGRNYQELLKLSDLHIWISAVCIGTLASIPKLFRLRMEFGELLIDISISSLFTIFVWYYNLANLPELSERPKQIKFYGKRLVKSLLTGIVIMVLFVSIHQILLPKYELESMLTMYEFRGMIINIMINLFLYLIYQNYVTNKVNTELEKTKSDNINSQFELLKQQINPHFLFNSLNTLKSMVEMQDEKSADYIVMLSDFYRSSLEKRKENYISLEQEIKALSAFIFLLESRFEEGINLKIDIPKQYNNSVLPPFALQLLIENGIKHNIVSLAQPLCIDIYIENNHIIVENNLQLKRSVEQSTGIGLNNIKQRYLQTFGKTVQIIKEPNYFKVKLPICYEGDHY